MCRCCWLRCQFDPSRLESPGLNAIMKASVLARQQPTGTGQHVKESLRNYMTPRRSPTTAARHLRTVYVQAVQQVLAADTANCHGLALGRTLAARLNLKRLICSSTQSELQASAAAATRQPDLLFEHPSGVQICVFGVEHLQREAHIGEWILANRPAAVVVETACTPEHGAAPGRAVTCRDQVPGAAGMFLRVFCQIAAAIQEQGEAAMAPGAIWSQAVSQFNGEQLAYVAALATGAQLLFGDRPKEVTYRRLFTQPTLEELDVAFAAEVAASYSSSLLQVQHQEQHYQQWQRHQQQLASTCVWNIMMKEREAVMLGVIDDLCRKGLLLLPGLPPPTVVLVVGSAHLPGLQELWISGGWRDMIGPDGVNSSQCPLMQAPRLDHSCMEVEGAGARRGLLESVLALSMPPEVLEDLQDVLPPVPDSQADARQYTWEIYGTYRMQLAALPDELLQQVCSGVRKGSSMIDVLEPLRKLRPVNGGPAWSEKVVMQLRTLNFDLSSGQTACSLEE